MLVSPASVPEDVERSVREDVSVVGVEAAAVLLVEVVVRLRGRDICSACSVRRMTLSTMIIGFACVTCGGLDALVRDVVFDVPVGAASW